MRRKLTRGGSFCQFPHVLQAFVLLNMVTVSHRGLETYSHHVAVHNMHHKWDRGGLHHLVYWRVGPRDLRTLTGTSEMSSKLEQHRHGWGQGRWRPLTPSEFLSFLGKPSLHSENSKQHFLSPQSIPPHPKSGTKDSLEPPVIQIETHLCSNSSGKIQPQTFSWFKRYHVIQRKRELKIPAAKVEPSWPAVLEGSWQDHSVWTSFCLEVTLLENQEPETIHLCPALCVCLAPGFIYHLWLHAPRIPHTQRSCQTGEGLPVTKALVSPSSSLSLTFQVLIRWKEGE